MIELFTFVLADGVSVDDFLAADKRVQQEFFPYQHGAARRTTARNDDGWIVITLWSSREAADAAAMAAREDDACRAFAALIAGEQLSRYESLPG